MNRLTLFNVSRRSGTQQWIDLGPLVEVESGELVVLVGKHGAGKTLLSRVICGLEPCDGGRIELGGRSLAGVPPHRRRVGLVMQNDALWPHWSLRQNIAFPLRCSGQRRKARNRRLDELLADAGLEDLADLKPAKVSREACGLALLARAVALEPDLLVIDEPFEAGGILADFSWQIQRLREREKLTTLILTRSASHALALADRVGWLSSGRLLQIGTPHEIYSRPVSEEVARAFGPVNRLEGEIESLDARRVAVVQTALGRITGRLLGSGTPSQGEPVRLLFRPESLVHGAAGFGSNRLSAAAAGRVLDGPLCHIRLVGHDGWEGTAIVLAGQAASIKEGLTLSFSLSADSVSVLPANLGQSR